MKKIIIFISGIAIVFLCMYGLYVVASTQILKMSVNSIIKSTPNCKQYSDQLLQSMAEKQNVDELLKNAKTAGCSK